ncbi:MAG TPA: polysaccharide biosynthesis/export family protein [Thermodesulfobacteriota bacterium]|nr:polysaccharide biosynthesis/export family protein [Thermodesulfobacteriota bacterium]
MTKELYLSLLLVLFVTVTVSCGGGKKVPDSLPPESRIESDQEIKELNSRLIAQASGAPASPADYLIGPADLLEVKVFESEKLTSTVRVSSRGQITLALLESVDVDGLTAREAEEKIENLLKKGGYLNNPHVSVFVAEYKSKLVSVVGFVVAPGSYDLLGRQTLLDALAAAKGLSNNAGRAVYLTRTEDSGRRQAYVVDINELLLKGNSEINVALKPGDVIYVPEAGTVFVEGAVRNPSVVPIKEGSTTVTKSIIMAGGLTSYANGSDVKLVRYLGNDKREVMELDLGKIRKGEADDPIVRDGDAVIVGVNTFKRVLYGLRLNFFYSLVGVGYDPPRY